MFAIIFTFALVTAHVAAEIPSYMHICSRQDPNLDQCIINSINDLRDKICEGIPELESPPLNQFSIDKLDISDTDNAKLYVRDAKLTGICDFNFNFLHIDLDKLHLDIDLSFKRVYLNGTYDFDIHVLVPFVHKGPVYFVTDNVGAKFSVELKMITKGDKKYIYLSKLNLNLDITNLDTKFDVNGKDSSQLNEIIATFVGSNQEEFIQRVEPSLEKEISKQILLIGNNIIKHFTFDQLFPEHT